MANKFVLNQEDGTVEGGNVRGSYAVDLQMVRSSADQVAQRPYDIILGGINNKTSTNSNGGTTANVIVGGSTNYIESRDSGRCFIGAGSGNQILARKGNDVIVGGGSNTINYGNNGSNNFIGAGSLNTITGANTTHQGRANVVVGGYDNNSNNSDFSFIGGGYQNNINTIKYGTISGGQSNTASTNNYATVVGGSSNTSSGQYSVSGGYSNIASGLGSVALGYDNTASNGYSVAMGFNNTASGEYSFSHGRFNSSSGYKAYTFGELSSASGNTSFAMGFRTQSISSYSFALSDYSRAYLKSQLSLASGQFSTWGDAQQSILTSRKEDTLTTGATTTLSLDGTGTTSLIIPYGTNMVWNVTVETQAVVTNTNGTSGIAAGDVYSEVSKLTFKKIGGVSSLVGIISRQFVFDGGMGTAQMNYSAGASQELAIEFQAPAFGAGDITVRVVSKVSLVEVAY